MKEESFGGAEDSGLVFETPIPQRGVGDSFQQIEQKLTARRRAS